jgi:hypothetical protein
MKPATKAFKVIKISLIGFGDKWAGDTQKMNIEHRITNTLNAIFPVYYSMFNVECSTFRLSLPLPYGHGAIICSSRRILFMALS